MESLSQPGGNVTGFTNYEYSIGPKWLELLKQIAPAVTSVGILRDPTNVAEIGMLGAIETAGPQFGVEFRPVDTRTVAELEHSIAAVARSGHGGLIITPTTLRCPCEFDRDHRPPSEYRCERFHHLSSPIGQALAAKLLGAVGHFSR